MDEEMTRSHVTFDAVSARRAKPFTIATHEIEPRSEPD
jgi:hypothetical protein